jgi:hypothetical protein
MSNKLVAGFAFQFKGDGTHDSVSITLATGPVAIFEVGGSAGNPSLLSGVTSGVPSAVSSLNCSPSLTIQSSSLLLGILTVTFTAAPTDGTIYTISGILEF